MTRNSCKILVNLDGPNPARAPSWPLVIVRFPLVIVRFVGFRLKTEFSTLARQNRTKQRPLHSSPQMPKNDTGFAPFLWMVAFPVSRLVTRLVALWVSCSLHLTFKSQTTNPPLDFYHVLLPQWERTMATAGARLVCKPVRGKPSKVRLQNLAFVSLVPAGHQVDGLPPAPDRRSLGVEPPDRRIGGPWVSSPGIGGRRSQAPRPLVETKLLPIWNLKLRAAAEQ